MAKDKKLKAQIERQLAAISKQQITSQVALEKIPSASQAISYPGLSPHSVIKKDLLKILSLLIMLATALILIYTLSIKTSIISSAENFIFKILNLR